LGLDADRLVDAEQLMMGLDGSYIGLYYMPGSLPLDDSLGAKGEFEMKMDKKVELKMWTEPAGKVADILNFELWNADQVRDLRLLS
jgi:hypothetical protein